MRLAFSRQAVFGVFICQMEKKKPERASSTLKKKLTSLLLFGVVFSKGNNRVGAFGGRYSHTNASTSKLATLQGGPAIGSRAQYLLYVLPQLTHTFVALKRYSL